jgi:predicted metal-dependent hydrolase
MRGFIGQEAVHADTHERMLHEFMVARGVDPEPILAQIEHVFRKTLAPSTSSNPAGGSIISATDCG